MKNDTNERLATLIGQIEAGDHGTWYGDEFIELLRVLRASAATIATLTAERDASRAIATAAKAYVDATEAVVQKHRGIGDSTFDALADVQGDAYAALAAAVRKDVTT